MADLMAITNGNFTDSAHWGVVDATSKVDADTTLVALTTSYVAATTSSTPGAITIDAIAVKFGVKTGSVGTVSVDLAIAGVQVTGSEVTINASDIPACNASGPTWVLFKLAAPITLLAATAYTPRLKASVAAQLSVFVSASNNWTRLLRTTTTAAPAAGDITWTFGEVTGAGITTRTTNLDSTSSATAYGQISSSCGGTVTVPTTASTNFYTKIAGDLIAWAGGIVKQGTVAAPIPSTSKSEIEYACSSAGQYGLINRGGEIYTKGTPKLSKTTLNADASASATSLTTTDVTGWLANDEIGLASTTTTPGQAELKVMSGNASANTVPIAALTNAHSGSGRTKGHLINLTRNVRQFSTSAVNVSYFRLQSTLYGTTDMRDTEFKNWGANNSQKGGIRIESIAGSGNVYLKGIAIQQNSIGGSTGISISGTSADNMHIEDVVIYNPYNAVAYPAAMTAGSAMVLDNVFAMKVAQGGFDLNTPVGTITNNCINAMSGNVAFNLGSSSPNHVPTIKGNAAYCGVGGYLCSTPIIAANRGMIIEDALTWGFTGYGLAPTQSGHYWKNPVSFGNPSNLQLSQAVISDLIIVGGQFDGHAALSAASTKGVSASNSAYGDNIRFINCNFGTIVPHALGDVGFSMGAGNIQLINCTLASTTEFSLNTILGDNWFASDKHDGVDGNHKLIMGNGRVETDTTIYKANSPSSRLTPVTTALTTKSARKKIPVAAGETITVSVYVRKSVVGDGTVYNGAQPRLVEKAGYCNALLIDTVRATATNAANGAWEQLTYTTGAAARDGIVEFYVDCDGTTGWVNVEDWVATPDHNMNGGKYIDRGQPLYAGEYVAPSVPVNIYT